MTSPAAEVVSLPESTMAEFLETQPPGAQAIVSDFHIKVEESWHTNTPDLQLHCDAALCNGMRIFHAPAKPSIVLSEWTYFFVEYRCRNCERNRKIFALFGRNTTGDYGHIHKIGEFPGYGPPLPSRVISLVGPDRDLFLRGRRSENQGLGIGAFAYYRRVVENQWQRILGEVLRVAERTGASTGALESLRRALNETQFGKAVEIAKDAIPDMIKINGHNPISLLHRALSEGLHSEEEEFCLGLAQSIRVILTELAERTAQAMSDEAEVRDALSRLLSRHSERSAKSVGRPEVPNESGEADEQIDQDVGVGDNS